MGYKAPLTCSHLLLRTGRSPNTLTVCCPSVAEASWRVPPIGCSSSSTAFPDDGKVLHIKDSIVIVIIPVLNQCLQSWDRSLFQLHRQYSSALLLAADCISSLPSTWHKEGLTGNYPGGRINSTWKKKIIWFRWEQYVLIQKYFPLEQNFHLTAWRR